MAAQIPPWCSHLLLPYTYPAPHHSLSDLFTFRLLPGSALQDAEPTHRPCKSIIESRVLPTPRRSLCIATAQKIQTEP
ncbi:hypothetical protein BDZ89DRAFT_1063729 [Hymenopellis radicata]|nr:hypothetical protein BDZ89DRAFT_1063729 [Hymenopellis radicata]